jgi:protein SCO1/2
LWATDKVASKFLEDLVQRKTLWLGFALLAILVAVVAILWITKKPSLHGAIIEPPFPAADIQLTDFSGRPFVLSSLRGKIVLIYFGYTNCPDECPLTMAHLKQAVDVLGSRGQDVQVAMVTTDPARDTPQVLKDWLGKFNPTFLGLWGTPDELAKVWKDYGVTVEENGETHSNFIYVIDRAGDLRETFLPDSLPADQAADVRILLGE